MEAEGKKETLATSVYINPNHPATCSLSCMPRHCFLKVLRHQTKQLSLSLFFFRTQQVPTFNIVLLGREKRPTIDDIGMKSKASGGVLNKTLAALASMARSKTLALKSKTRALRTRLIIFSLLSNRKFLMSTISHKLHGVFAHAHHHLNKKLESHDDINGDGDGDGDGEAGAEDSEGDGAVVLYRDSMAHDTVPDPVRTELSAVDNIGDGSNYHGYDDGGDGRYPDLSHLMFDSEDLEFEDPGGSVIDLVKNSKQEAGESFSLEEEIDEVAELFIKRFHRQIRMQKQQSFKEFQEMLQRGL